jgi:hypothetical protein
MKNSKVIEELSREKYIEICNETFNWCLKKFGTPIKNTVPTINISFDKRVKRNYGSYLDGKITVYPNVCKTPKFIIRTILHEYRHFLQMPNNNHMEIYYTLSKNFKYVEHPFEIDSGVFEKQHYKSCKRYLKNKKII